MHRVFQNSDALLDETEQVLLCLSKPRDRSLLREALSEMDLEVAVADDPDSLPAFDLCLVDTASYQVVASELHTRRERPGPVLPVVLVLGPQDNEAAAREVAADIDDVLAVPTSEAVLRKRVESLLRTRRQSKHLALFRRAMDDAGTGITIADAGGDQELRYVNEAFVEMTGYDREEALGQNCRFLQGPETDPETVREIRAAIDERRPVSVELRNYRKDGTMFWNRLEIAPVYSGASVSHFVGIQQDITERVERDIALSRYERIVHAAGDPIYALDEDLRFTLVNESTLALADRTEADLLDSHVTSLFGEEHGQRLAAAVGHLLESDDEFETTIESTVTNDTGQLRRYQTAIGVLPGEDFDGVVCVSRDITDSREREARLSVLDRVLRHNLRNKMMVIQAQAEQVRWHGDGEALDEAAAKIERTADELLDLAETARKFGRTVDPAEDDAVGPIDVGTHLCHAVAETGNEYGTATILADVPKPQWATAHDSFELAMTELLEWAATAGEGTTVRVSLTVDGEEGEVDITVGHDGSGLDDVEVAALSSGVESDLQHTQGLGLWFVRWMTVNSGGRFSIANADPGARVELTLPLAEPPAE